MPTASGAMTAAEKDEKYRLDRQEALAALAAMVTTPEQIAADVATFLASEDQYGKRDVQYPAGAECVMGRGKARIVDEGEAMAWALRQALPDKTHVMRYTSFGLFAGRQSLFYGVSEYVR